LSFAFSKAKSFEHILEMLKIDTIYSADSVEFCPQSPNTIAIGTYQVLEPNKDGASSGQSPGDNGEEEQSVKTARTGRLYLYEFNSDGLDIDNINDYLITDDRL
jgi:hypothetical protein